jgi:hypothetical protein
MTKPGFSGSVPIRIRNKHNKRGIKKLLISAKLTNMIKTPIVNVSMKKKKHGIIITYINKLLPTGMNEKLARVVHFFIKNSLTSYDIAVLNKSFNKECITLDNGDLLINIFNIWTVKITRILESRLIMTLIYAVRNIAIKSVSCYCDAEQLILNEIGINQMFVKYIKDQDKVFMQNLDLGACFIKKNGNSNAYGDRIKIMYNMLCNISNVYNCCSNGHNLVMLASCLKMFKNNITVVLAEQNSALTAYLCYKKTFDYPKTTFWYTTKNKICIKAAGVKFIMTFCSSSECSCSISVQYSNDIYCFHAMRNGLFDYEGQVKFRSVYISNRHFLKNKTVEHNIAKNVSLEHCNKCTCCISYNIVGNAPLSPTSELIPVLNPVPIHAPIHAPIPVPIPVPIHVPNNAPNNAPIPELHSILFEFPDLTIHKSLFSSLDTILYNSKLSEIFT